jgi:hypothetical protein
VAAFGGGQDADTEHGWSAGETGDIGGRVPLLHDDLE